MFKVKIIAVFALFIVMSVILTVIVYYEDDFRIKKHGLLVSGLISVALSALVTLIALFSMWAVIPDVQIANGESVQNKHKLHNKEATREVKVYFDNISKFYDEAKVEYPSFLGIADTSRYSITYTQRTKVLDYTGTLNTTLVGKKQYLMLGNVTITLDNLPPNLIQALDSNVIYNLKVVYDTKDSSNYTLLNISEQGIRTLEN